jgi:hypothetical protein
MARKAASKVEGATTTATPPAAPAPAEKPMSAMERLRAKAAPPVAAPAAGKKAKQTLPCENDEESAALDGLTSSDTVMKVAIANQTTAKLLAQTIFIRKFLKRVVGAGYMLDNPLLQSEHSRANLVVKHMSKFKRSASDGTPLDVGTALTGLGFGDHVVKEVTEKIIKSKESLGLKKFTDLTADDATPEQKAVAEKLMGFVLSLTDQEQALVLEAGVTYEVNDNWQDRAVQIAIESVNKADPAFVDKATDRLEALFKVIPPQFVISQMNFTGSLPEAFTQMQKPQPVSVVESTSPDNKYKTKTTGNEVSLYVVKPDGVEDFLGTKKCTDASHALNTVKKLWRQPEAITEFIAAAKK